ncbi:MAG: conjugal transfer protein TraL [Acidobacteria bacterium]|nr:conjugal transfer protein TraL [Acidobacteriota bacterium]
MKTATANGDAGRREISPVASAPATVHFVLQGKGGVGKSFVASILGQYFQTRGREVRCFDTDPVNQTFAQYRELGVERLDLLVDGSIDQRAFDGLVERLLTEEGCFVVDNGASTFIPMWNYILENDVVRVLSDTGRRVFVHCVITGGQALTDTLTGFAKLAETTPDRNVVLWVNEYFGRVERDGKPLSELPVYRDHVDKVWGSVAIPKRNRDTFGRDVEDLLRRKMTFRQAFEGADFPIMVRQRLKVVQRELFEQLDSLAVL